jgi:hypothetical protein
VHGDIRGTLLHGNFEFLDEQAFATYLLQAAIEDLVPARRERYQFDILDVIEPAEFGGDVFRLPEGKRTFASSYSDQQGA